jgi:hypothetical protein
MIMKWSKVRAGLYATKYDKMVIAIQQITAKKVSITGWWIIEIYDGKGKFIEQLDAYPTLKEAKLAAIRDYKNWNK